ncbi:unnamed protein product, partial [Symbiodinium sp. KB8]
MWVFKLWLMECLGSAGIVMLWLADPAVPKAFTALWHDAAFEELIEVAADSTPDKLHVEAFGPKEKAAPERDLGFNELHLPTVQEVGAAMRECNAWFYSPRYAYRVNPITGKSEQVVQGEIPDGVGCTLLAGIFLTNPKAWEAHGDELDEFKSLGETAYNVTEWDLSLANMSFSLGGEWTLEGWHYLLAHGGVIWDTRERLGNSTKSGVAVILSNNGSLALMILPRGGAPVLRSCSKFVPLRQWVHVACQRRASSLDFFLNGTKVCNMPAPAELESLEPQTTVKIGAATNEEDSSLASLVSNMRLTGAALYERPASIPERHLQLHPKTHFLLHGGYLDQVSSRPLLISGHGLMEGIVNHGHPTGKLKHPAMRELQLNLFPDQDRALPGGLPGKWGPQAGRRAGFCARTILTIIKDAGTIAASIEADLKDQKLVGMECAVDATRVVRSAGNAAKYMAELGFMRGAGPFRGYFRCAGRMEGVAWELDVLGTELGSTVESCHNLDLDYRHIQRMNATKKGINWGRCAGEVASSAGYASTAGLYVASAGGYDCPAAVTPKQKKAAFNASKNPWTYKRLTKQLTPGDLFRTDCAIESLAFTRMIFLSGAKATSAGQHCSGPSKTVCPRNIFLSLAAFAGVGEVGSLLHKWCLAPTSCCRYIKSDYVCSCGAVERQKAWKENRLRVGKCARFAGSTAKLIGSAVTFAAEAFHACGDDASLPAVCSSMVTFAIASLGYFAENAARSHYECVVSFMTLLRCAEVINCGALGGTAKDVDTGSEVLGVLHCYFGQSAGGLAWYIRHAGSLRSEERTYEVHSVPSRAPSAPSVYAKQAISVREVRTVADVPVQQTPCPCLVVTSTEARQSRSPVRVVRAGSGTAPTRQTRPPIQTWPQAAIQRLGATTWASTDERHDIASSGHCQVELAVPAGSTPTPSGSSVPAVIRGTPGPALEATPRTTPSPSRVRFAATRPAEAEKGLRSDELRDPDAPLMPPETVPSAQAVPISDSLQGHAASFEAAQQPHATSGQSDAGSDELKQSGPEQGDVLSKQSMDVLMTFMQEQMKHFEDRLKMELLGRLRGSAVQRSAQAAASLEEKLLLQIQRVQEEGERLREPRGTPRETPRREESSEEPSSDGRRDDNHESERETVKELLINFRKLAAELQMQITRLDRLDMDIGGRLGGLEEGIRRLDAENAKLTEQLTESARRLAAPVALAEDLQQAVRSLEEALESWQSHTQHLEDDLRSRMEELSHSVARLEPSKGQSPVQASPKGQSSPSRASPAQRTIPSLPTSTAFLNLVSILPAYSPSSQDRDALVGMGRADSPGSDDVVPSLAVPLLAGAE